MSSIFIFFILLFTSQVFLEFQEKNNDLLQTNGRTIVIKSKKLTKEEITTNLVLLGIIIFGIWGILISLGAYNF